MFHKGSGDSSFAEVLPCEQLAPGLLAASPQSTLQLTYLNPKGNVKQPFYSIIEVT